jgi:hypothetical protein
MTTGAALETEALAEQAASLVCITPLQRFMMP